MTPQAYLQYCVQHKCYRKRAWLISVFSMTRETDVQKTNTYTGKLIREPFGLFVILEDGTKEKLDAPQALNAPLFTLKDAVSITPAWLSSVKEPKVETTLGILLVNLICLFEAFGGKFPYQNGKLTLGKLEDQIASRLQSNPKEGEKRLEDALYVDEYLKFCEGVSFLETLSQVFTHSITRIGILPAPGRQVFKKELLKKYEGRLRDPVVMNQFEGELSDFDKAYLKNDPAYGKFMTGKVSNSRMKSFMTQGGESNSFVGEMTVTPIIPALEDGIPLDAEGFTAITNNLRYSSFARGAETVNGGVTAKALMRAADNWRITKGDCGVTLGVRRVYRDNEVKLLVGRYLLLQNKPVLIETEEQAKQYIGRGIIIRSPQYCRRPGTQTCEVCAGIALSKYPTGVSIPLMEVSGGILTDSLKMMHNSALKTETMNLPSVIS